MFDSNAYWLWRAPHYRNEKRLDSPWYRDQEAGFVDIVKAERPRSILEVGCNYGRITSALRVAFPAVPIAACDLCPEAIANATVPGVRFFVHDLCCTEPLLSADLCVAAEVLLHHPEDAVRHIVRKIMASCLALLHEVPDIPGGPIAPHCYVHDYQAVYADMGINSRVIARSGHVYILVTR